MTVVPIMPNLPYSAHCERTPKMSSDHDHDHHQASEDWRTDLSLHVCGREGDFVCIERRVRSAGVGMHEEKERMTLAV